MKDAAGIVKAQTSTVIFFLVHETGFGRQIDLAPDNDFDLVVKELRIERISEGVDTANIVTGSRTRRKSTKYNTGMDVDMTG